MSFARQIRVGRLDRTGQVRADGQDERGEEAVDLELVVGVEGGKVSGSVRQSGRLLARAGCGRRRGRRRVQQTEERRAVESER